MDSRTGPLIVAHTSLTPRQPVRSARPSRPRAGRAVPRPGLVRSRGPGLLCPGAHAPYEVLPAAIAAAGHDTRGFGQGGSIAPVFVAIQSWQTLLHFLEIGLLLDDHVIL